MRPTTFLPALLLLATAAQAKPEPPTPPPLTRIAVISLKDVEGRMDHFAVDTNTRRLFVSALENHTVEVIDLARNKRLHTLSNINEPQGLLFLPLVNRLFVCSRGDGTLRSFNATTYREGAWCDLGQNADNLCYDPATRSLLVGSNGEPGPGKLSAVSLASLLPTTEGGDPTPRRSRADLRVTDQPGRVDPASEIELPSHPESFQLDPAAHRAFVNVPDDNSVTVIDTSADPWRIATRWPVPVQRNFSLAYDPAASRVFVAARNPATLLTYDALTGELLSQTPCAEDIDDLYYDATRRRLYLIGGGQDNARSDNEKTHTPDLPGAIQLFELDPDNKTLRLLQTVPTPSRARTGALIPSENALALAVPHTPDHPAALWIYRIN